jgi:hypothetical protein
VDGKGTLVVVYATNRVHGAPTIVLMVVRICNRSKKELDSEAHAYSIFN